MSHVGVIAHGAGQDMTGVPLPRSSYQRVRPSWTKVGMRDKDALSCRAKVQCYPSFSRLLQMELH